MNVSGEKILEIMVEGKGYSRRSFALMFPGADERLVFDVVANLTKQGKLWNGNGVTYIKFPQRDSSLIDGVTVQVGPCHEWGELKGYGDNLKSHRALSEGTRGADYKARPIAFPQFDGCGGNSFQAKATAIIRGLL